MQVLAGFEICFYFSSFLSGHCSNPRSSDYIITPCTYIISAIAKTETMQFSGVLSILINKRQIPGIHVPHRHIFCGEQMCMVTLTYLLNIKGHSDLDLWPCSLIFNWVLYHDLGNNYAFNSFNFFRFIVRKPFPNGWTNGWTVERTALNSSNCKSPNLFEVGDKKYYHAS